MTAEAVGLGEQERFDRLRLIRSDGIGPASFVALVERHGSAAAVIAALPDIQRRAGRPIRLAAERDIADEIAATVKLGGRFLFIGEPDYPALLAGTDGAPPVLAAMGRTEVLRRPLVAIVGARNASASGLKLARSISADLASAGFVTVSGLARGIDHAAHVATLESGTVAAIAGGLGAIYPPQHGPLAIEIARCGCILSEMPLRVAATARDFPRRNRIVAGLSVATLVIEAALRSGSLITARLAADYGRQVFAVPGVPGDPRAEGTNALIRGGATLTRNAADIIEDVLPTLHDAAPSSRPRQIALDLSPPPPARVVPVAVAQTEGDGFATLLGPAPVSVDDLIRLSGLTPREVQMELLQLELDGRLQRHGGGLVSLAAPAS